MITYLTACDEFLLIIKKLFQDIIPVSRTFIKQIDVTKKKKSHKKEKSVVKKGPTGIGFGEVKKINPIKTKEESKSSKEQIMNQAFKFHLEGKISEAKKNYEYLINQGFKDPRVFSNYGIILKSLDQPQKAELFLLKAIEINPSFEDAHLNLGSTLIDLGKLQDAEIYTRKAIDLNPEDADAHGNLGNILKELGKSQESFNSYLKAIQINPRLSHLYSIITDLFTDLAPSKVHKSDLRNVLNILLERDDVQHKNLFEAFNYIYGNKLTIHLKELESDFFKEKSHKTLINESFIINGLKKIIFNDIKFENELTKLRKKLCIMIEKNNKNLNFNALQFTISLAQQCFFNEYVYLLTKEEEKAINIIINKCRDSEINETYISIIACYLPLYKVLNQIPYLKSYSSSNENFKELIQLQISEPLKEIELSHSIKTLGKINDSISQRVRSQYEENPYPRWKHGSISQNTKISSIQVINAEIRPNLLNCRLNSKQLNILIAGCGTGNQILQAQRYRNAKLTAIDLSLSSLSYSQRKINEMSIKNVDLIQMDILDVYLLKKQFDIIECSGVLHHMNDPSQGLKALLDILKPNGFIKLGLYSELARQDVIKARKYIEAQELKTNDRSIRNFRQKVISGELKDLNYLTTTGDFYSLSQCRDLCFHCQEHRFTINQIQETLSSNKLDFLGFLLSKNIKSLYKNYFPEDKTQTNLQNWSIFEENHPNTFREMYQFWVCKTKN